MYPSGTAGAMRRGEGMEADNLVRDGLVQDFDSNSTPKFIVLSPVFPIRPVAITESGTVGNRGGDQQQG